MVASSTRGTLPVIEATSSGLVPQVTIGGRAAASSLHLAVEMGALVGEERLPIGDGARSQASPFGAFGRPSR